jgi:hypothetical protein
LDALKEKLMRKKTRTCGSIGWGQDHQVVGTNVKAAFLVIPFKHPQPPIILGFSTPIMSLKGGNASVAPLSLILEQMLLVQRRLCRKYSASFFTFSFFFFLQEYCEAEEM